MKSKSKAVYLSFDTLKPDFGKIIIIDLNTLKSVTLIDNNFYNSNPLFFDKDRKILFASARIGNPYQLRVTSYHAWRQLYQIDCDSLTIQPYFKSDEAPNSNEINKFIGLSRDFKRKQVYFVNDDNKMYKIQDYTTKPILLTTFDKDFLIFDLRISLDEKYIAVWYNNMKNLITGIYVYDISSNKVIDDIRSSKKSVKLVGWTIDNNLIYQDDSLFVMNLNSNVRKLFDINLDSKKHNIKNIYAENQDSYILLVDKLVYNENAKYNITNSSEIARYNCKLKIIEWLTNDGHIKKELNIFSTFE